MEDVKYGGQVRQKGELCLDASDWEVQSFTREGYTSSPASSAGWGYPTHVNGSSGRREFVTLASPPHPALDKELSQFS